MRRLRHENSWLQDELAAAQQNRHTLKQGGPRRGKQTNGGQENDIAINPMVYLMDDDHKDNGNNKSPTLQFAQQGKTS